MAASTHPKHRWNTREYDDIASTRYEGGTSHVSFMDGSDVILHADLLDMYGVADHQWEGARSETHHIAILTRSADVEIPWDVIRALTDQEFSDFLSEHEAVTERRIESRFPA